MDVANEGCVEQLLGVRPKLVAAFALPGRVGDETGDELQNIFLAMDVRKRVVMHGLLEVDGVEHPYLIPRAL